MRAHNIGMWEVSGKWEVSPTPCPQATDLSATVLPYLTDNSSKLCAKCDYSCKTCYLDAAG